MQAVDVEPAPAVEARVLDVVRALAEEVGGSRAARAAAPHASLSRDLGLGSLERVELLARLESAFSRTLDETFLSLDTPAELARALAEAGAGAPAAPAGRAERVAPASEVVVVDAPTVHGVLWQRACAEPDRPHVFMREEDGTEHTVTYGRLWAEAARVGGGLRARGIRRGDTVALMLPTGLDFLRSFHGILACGAVPVPIYPPARLDRLAEYAERQGSILADAGVRALVTVPRGTAVTGLLRPRVPTLEHVVTAEELTGSGASVPGDEGAGPDPAFIQYTSGSTGQPKGVLLSHDNLLANIQAITAGLQAGPTDVGVSWLPLYHDMGLIASWLFCMRAGIPIAIMSPLAFLARPERWLWTIHARRGTLSAAPNFAYELCTRRIPDSALEGLDLSSWRCAMNGAEPVSPATLDRFAKRFERYGLRREALMPLYGLAESSVALVFPPAGRGVRVLEVEREPFETAGVVRPAEGGHALPFVSVGRALPEHEVRIVDEAGRDLPEDRVGRLVFRGPSSTAGYYRKPEATAAITLPGGFLDSGDLAFVHAGEVYIAGRRKDLIIKGGRNLVPQEIEEVAATVEGVRKGCVIAFGVANPETGTESLVVVAESRATDPAEKERLSAAVTERVASAVGVPPDAVAIVAPGAVPKTSSGKVRRGAARDAWRKGTLGREGRTTFALRAGLLARVAWSSARPWLLAVPRALYVGSVYLAAALAAPAVWVAVLALPRPRAVAFVRGVARTLLRAAGCRLTTEGLAHLDRPGPHVIVANHASYADAPALLAVLPGDVRFVAKREVLSWPVIGAFVRKAGYVTVERFEQGQSVADAGKIARVLEEGASVLVFPEGTFTSAAGLRPFRLGAFKTAVEAGVPVVPVALRGTRKALRRTWLPRPLPIHVWAGEPIAAEGEGWHAMVRLRDRAAAVIAAECGEPRLDLVSGGPERG